MKIIPKRIIVEISNCNFNVVSTLEIDLTLMQCVDRILTKKQKNIPKAISINGYIKLEIIYWQPEAAPIKVVDDITKAAQVD